ncbi:MAG: TolC family protein [Prolixibacteraceae bacterium]
MRKKILIALIVLAGFHSPSLAQNQTDRTLAEIEKNNTRLSALRKRAEADKLENKTGISLQNPEAAFNYLWGTPSGIGNRTDISITQTFDFPAAYGIKNQISDLKNEQLELEYEKQKKGLLLKARLICVDLIYTNALKKELTQRHTRAERIAGSFKSKFNAGEINILDYNKAQLSLLKLTKEMELLDIERKSLLGELARLNGGTPVDFTDDVFPQTLLPADFDQWYAVAEQRNPLLNWLKKEVELSRKQVSLHKALSLPKFQAGYMSEKVVGERFQGLTVGMSIPLWETKNTVKYAKANEIAVESAAADSKADLYNELRALHAKAVQLKNSSREYQSQLKEFDNSRLLVKALDKGEISLIDYLVELSVWYESRNRVLELEKEKNRSIAELNWFL